MIYTNTSLNSCDSNANFKTLPVLCGSDGPKLALAETVFIFLLLAVFCFVEIEYRKSLENDMNDCIDFNVTVANRSAVPTLKSIKSSQIVIKRNRMSQVMPEASFAEENKDVSHTITDNPLNTEENTLNNPIHKNTQLNYC